MTSKNDKPLFYEEVVPLSREQHGDLYIADPENGFSYAKGTNSVYVFGMEFIRICKEYPIVFTSHNDETYPIALLGLRQGQNVFLNDDGSWNARYIPAYVRRYPFILANQGDDQFVICIDNKYPGLNSKGKGQKLYGEHEDGPVIEQAKDFLLKFENHIRRTRDFCKMLRELDLLVPMKADVEENNEKFSLKGFEIIDRQRIFDLDDEVIIKLVHDDDLELIYEHLTSLETVSTFLEQMK